VARRRRSNTESRHAEFQIRSTGWDGPADGIALKLDDRSYLLPTPGLPELFRHLLLKQALNIHSTLVMGRLGRYEGNVMTWVRPSNGKLVDRAVRTVQLLLEREGKGSPRYEDVVRSLFREIEAMPPDDSAVLRAFRTMRSATPGTRRWRCRPAAGTKGRRPSPAGVPPR
jgi:hypothetical protein